MNKKQAKAVTRCLDTLHRMGFGTVLMHYTHDPIGMFKSMTLGTLQHGASCSKLDGRVGVELVPKPKEKEEVQK